MRVVPASRLGRAIVPVADVVLSAHALELVREFVSHAVGVRTADVDNVARLALRQTPLDGFALVSGVAVAVVQVQRLIVLARGVLGADGAAAQCAVKDASVVRVFPVAVDALAAAVAGVGVGSALGVVLAVRVVGAAEIRLTVIAVAMITGVANADLLGHGCVDTVRVSVAGTASATRGSLHALIPVTLVALQASALITPTALRVRARRIGWAVLLVAASD